MSTVKTDNVAGSFTPLPVINSANAVETYLATAGQTVFTTTKFDQTSAIKVFTKVGSNFVEVVAAWTSTNIITISGIVLTAGQKLYAYSVGDTVLRKDLASGTPSLVAPESIQFSGRNLGQILADTKTLKHYGVVGNGVVDDTLNMQKAADSGSMIWPSGPFTPKITSTIFVAPGTFIGGMGHGQSKVTTSLDIEMFRSTLDIGPTASVADIGVRDLTIERTLPSASYTTYHIRLRNPSRCNISGLFVTQNGTYTGSSTRTGGLWLEAGAGTTYPGSVNKVHNCLFDNASLWVQARDNHFDNIYVWGQNLNKSVYVEGSGNYFNQVEVIPSPHTAGFYFTSSAQGCTLDSPIVDGSISTVITGTGIYANRAYGLTINSAQIYNAFKHGIHFVDMLEGGIYGARFTNGNRINDPLSTGYDPAIAYDDILLESATFASSGNIIDNNRHKLTGTRTTKGYAIRELNNGTAPGPQTITNNYVSFGQYTAPNILRVNTGTSMLNNRGSSAVQTVSSGTATVLSGTGSITFSHSVPDVNVTDSELIVRPTSSLASAGVASWYAVRISATQFTITLNANATANVTFAWSVSLR